MNKRTRPVLLGIPLIFDTNLLKSIIDFGNVEESR